MNTIGPAYALFVYHEMRDFGVSDSDLFQKTHLNRELLEQGNNIPMDGFIQLLINADALRSDGRLGLAIGRRSNILVLGIAGMAAACAPNLRLGLQVLDAYSRLHVSYMRIRTLSNLHGMTLSVTFMLDVRSTERFHIETATMVFQSYLETVFGLPVSDAHYHLPYSRPDYADEFESLIHGDVSYNQKATTIQVPRRLLDRASPYYDRNGWQQSQKFLADRIKLLTETESADTPYTQHVHALLQAQEPPLPNLNTVAEQLHISERTLNRRLQEEGTNLREIKAALTHSWAKQYLTESDLSVEAISSILGYQDTANFRRAFRNREACSPKEFRQKKSLTQDFSRT